MILLIANTEHYHSMQVIIVADFEMFLVLLWINDNNNNNVKYQ